MTNTAKATTAVVLVPTLERDSYIPEIFTELKEAVSFYLNCISGGAPAYSIQVWLNDQENGKFIRYI